MTRETESRRLSLCHPCEQRQYGHHLMTATSLHRHADVQKARNVSSFRSSLLKQLIEDTPRTRHDSTKADMMQPRMAFAAIAAMIAIRPISATVLPLPRLSAESSNSTSQLTTKIFYQQGIHSMNDMASSPGMCDAVLMATGDLKVGWCEGLTTSAVSISRIEGKECVFMMFRGSALCSVDATEIVSELDGRKC
jgi:hypothetical protein